MDTPSSLHVLDSLPVAAIATDMAGKILLWNQKAEEFYGWASSEVLGHPIYRVTVSADNQEQASAIMAGLQSGQCWTGMFTVRRKTGDPVLAAVVDVPVKDDDGSLVAILGVSRPDFAEEATDLNTLDLQFLQTELASLMADMAPSRALEESDSAVLIVEDDSANAKLMKLILHPIHCRLAMSAEEAVRCLQEASPELLILDYRLPDMDGLTLSRRARELGYEGPVLFVTAMSNQDDEYHELKRTFGADSVILKPFVPLDLIERVYRLVSTG